MPLLDLAFESGEASLAVRRFTVEEAISTPFRITVIAGCPRPDLDVGTIVGRTAAFRVMGTGGFNEIRFDDATGTELLHVRAERDLTKHVQNDETELTGGHREVSVKKDLKKIVDGAEQELTRVVGYGLADDDLDLLLGHVRALAGSSPPRHFALVAAETLTPFRKSRLQQSGIRLIPYDNPDGKPEAVTAILRQLAARA